MLLTDSVLEPLHASTRHGDCCGWSDGSPQS